MGLVLLVWDAPNIDMAIAELVGAKPTPATRPNFAAVARWLCQEAAATADIEACIFTNVPPDGASRMLPWVSAVRKAGFSIFAKPKIHPDDDIDDAMVNHVRQRQAEGKLERLVVASHDGRAFADLVCQVRDTGVATLVLGFAERTGALLRSATTFVDLEDIAGVFAQPLPRTNLSTLPDEGRWFGPLVELRPLAATPGEDVDEALPDPTAPAPDRDQLVATLHEFVFGEPMPVDLAVLGNRLRTRYPGFSSVAMGHVKLVDLVEDLAGEADIEVFRREGGHPAVRRPSD
jgi:uncharacterized protein